MANRQLEPFDPARDFVVRRQGFFCAGRRYNAGDAFRKKGLTDRQIKQFYEQRAIGYAGVAEAATPTMITPVQLEKMAAKSAAAIGSPEFNDAVEKMTKGNTRPALVKVATDLGVTVPNAANKADIARLIVEASGHESS